MLPPYIEQEQLDKLFKALETKQSHKKEIPRDRLICEVGIKCGLRRGETSALKRKDVHADFLMVLNSKNGKNRVVPMPASIAVRLNDFVKDMAPDESVFKLKPPAITMLYKRFAVKVGQDDLHYHSGRHYYATSLLERGVDIRIVQALLGHENISTTSMYLSVSDQRVKDAVKVLDEPKGKQKSHSEELTEAVTNALEIKEIHERNELMNMLGVPKRIGT